MFHILHCTAFLLQAVNDAKGDYLFNTTCSRIASCKAVKLRRYIAHHMPEFISQRPVAASSIFQTPLPMTANASIYGLSACIDVVHPSSRFHIQTSQPTAHTKIDDSKIAPATSRREGRYFLTRWKSSASQS
jgi:hypothetical protein